jgi:hypothetical protein
MLKWLEISALGVAVAGCVLVSGLASPTWATAIYEDDFESYDISGGPIDIVGQAAPTGQVYQATPKVNLVGGAGNINSMEVRNDVGIGVGNQGVGSNAGSGAAGVTSATVPLGTTLSSGVYTLGMDYVVTGNGSPQVFISNTANASGALVSLAVEGSPLHVALQGVGLGNHVVPGVNFTTPATVRFALTIDLDAQSLNLAWDGLDVTNDAVTGTYSTNFVSPGFQFSYLHFFNGAANNPHGFDNLILVEGTEIPEPAALSLLAMGVLGLMRRRRR